MIFQRALTVGSLFLASGCASVRSTGALLPQSSEDFGQESLHVRISHNCSAQRCTGFDATFENLLDEPLDLNVAASRLTRAGASMGLAIEGQSRSGIVTIPPRDSVKLALYPVSNSGKPLTYVRNSAVYCSLKVDPACAKPSEGEAKCAGFARYFYQSHVSTGGWITLSFVARAQSWLRSESFVSPEPQFMGTLPSVTLSSDTDAPWWTSSGGDVVFHKMECDASCRCRDVGKPRSFLMDDRFEPAER